MKRLVKTLALTSMLAASITGAQAGAGILFDTARSVIKHPRSLMMMVGGTTATISITYGVNMVRYGSWPLGALLILLNENDVISTEGVEALEGAEVSVKEAFLDIIASDLSEQEKLDELSELFQS